MPASNTVLIRFRSSGDKALEKAILDLAKAQALLEGKAKRYNNAVRRLKLDKERLNKEFGLATKNSRLVSNSFATLRSKLLLASFAAGMFAMTIGKLTKLFAEQEAAEKRLSTALGFTSQRLLDFASAMQKVTVFGDEVTISAMAQAAAFTTNEKAIEQITIAAQNLAAGRGMDLKTAMDLVSKSVFSSTNALSRYGIEIGKAKNRTDKFNKTMEAINKQYGGQAAAQVDTYAGAVAQLKNTWGDFGEDLGQVLASALLPIVQALALIAEGLLFIKPVLAPLITAMTSFGLAVLITSRRLKLAALGAKKTALAFIGLGKGAKAAAAGVKSLRAALSIGLFVAIEAIAYFLGKTKKETEAATVETVELKGAIEDLEMVFAGFTSIKDYEQLLQDIESINIKITTSVKSLKEMFEEKWDIDTSPDWAEMFGGLDMTVENYAAILAASIERLETVRQFGFDVDEQLSRNRKMLADLQGLLELKKQGLDVDKDIAEIMDQKRGMELANEKWRAKLIPDMEKKNALMQAELEHSGAQLEVEKLLIEARAKGVDPEKFNEHFENMLREITLTQELTNIKKKNLFITNSFNQAMVQGINNNMRFAESFGNMIKKMAADLAAHMITFLLFRSLIPGGGTMSALQYGINMMTGMGGTTTASAGLPLPPLVSPGATAGGAMQGLSLENQNAAMQGGSGSVSVNFSGNVLSQDFIENDAIPAIKQAIRRGADIGVS